MPDSAQTKFAAANKNGALAHGESFHNVLHAARVPLSTNPATASAVATPAPRQISVDVMS